MSLIYRDDRASMVASLEALQRENEDLRVENLALRVLVEPQSSGDALARLQALMCAILALAGAMFGASLLARSSASTSPEGAPRVELPLAAIALPEPVDSIRPIGPPGALSRAPTPSESPRPALPSTAALRAAFHGIAPALSRCLSTHGSTVRLLISMDGDGVVRETRVSARAPVGEDEARCAQDAARALRLDVERPTTLRYTVRVTAGGLRLRRARAR